MPDIDIGVALVATSLRALSAPAAVAESRRVLLACADGDQHTLALEALLAALAERRIDARMLGASVPASALVAAADTLRPAVIVVWSQISGTARPDLLETIAAMADLVVAAGPGWDLVDV